MSSFWRLEFEGDSWIFVNFWTTCFTDAVAEKSTLRISAPRNIMDKESDLGSNPCL